MIEVVYTQFSSRLPEDLWQRDLGRLPLRLQKEISRFRRWQDRQGRLLANLLLVEALRRFDFDDDVLNHLSYSEFGRPFLNHRVDFNISHSGGCVVCAATDAGRIGIDIEETRPIELNDFRNFLTSNEWETIQGSSAPYESFFEMWTIKESVIKANGKGLSVPLDEIHIHKDSALLYNETWFLKRLFIARDYACCLAADQRDAEVILRNVCF